MTEQIWHFLTPAPDMPAWAHGVKFYDDSMLGGDVWKAGGLAQTGDHVMIETPVFKHRHWWEFWKPKRTQIGVQNHVYVVVDAETARMLWAAVAAQGGRGGRMV